MGARDEEGFLTPIIGDGRPLLLLVAGGIAFAGGFAVFLAATGQFLPHDIAWLGMTADQLDQHADGRIVDFTAELRQEVEKAQLACYRCGNQSSRRWRLGASFDAIDASLTSCRVRAVASRDLGAAALGAAQTRPRSSRDTIDRMERAAPRANRGRPRVEV